jgi:hypothetical protein
MEIGHNNTQSQTFRPEPATIDNLNLMFVDIAGTDDTGGALIELINSFVSKYLFN